MKIFVRKLNKKSDLSLSVNAIVILIMAIVMLGLGLGFIKGMFSKVSSQVEGQITQEPDPVSATRTNPLTVSRESIVVKAGDTQVLKFSTFNVGTTDIVSGITIATCGLTKNTITTPIVTSNEYKTVTAVFTVGTTPGTTICTFTEDGPNTATVDVVVKITK